jgi:hypothetical protein
MDFDTVETGIDRRTCGLAVIFDNARDFGEFERAGLGGSAKVPVPSSLIR